MDPATQTALADEHDPIGALPSALAAQLGLEPQVPDAIHYFHGTRASDPASFVVNGLRPLTDMLDAIWSDLANLAEEISDEELDKLRDGLTAGSVGPHTYPLRVNGAIDNGPHGHLVRDALLNPEDYGSVDYLTGAEIAVDICQAVQERVGIDIGARYRKATRPCVVEFAMPASRVNSAVASAAWYVEAGLRGTHTLNSLWGYDGEGIPVPATAIVSVQRPDGTVLCST